MAVDSQIPLQILPNPHRSLPHPQLKCIGGRGKTKRNNNGMNQIRRKWRRRRRSKMKKEEDSHLAQRFSNKIIVTVVGLSHSLILSLFLSLSLFLRPPRCIGLSFLSFDSLSFSFFYETTKQDKRNTKKKLVDSILILGFMFLYGSRLIGFAGHRQLNSEGLHDTLRNDLYTVAVSWIRNTSRHWLQKQRHQQQQQSKKQKQQQWIQ